MGDIGQCPWRFPGHLLLDTEIERTLTLIFYAAEIELWSKEAPKACRNFIASVELWTLSSHASSLVSRSLRLLAPFARSLCMEGYYDGLIFHRIVADFIIQTGDPTGTGNGGESFYGGELNIPLVLFPHPLQLPPLAADRPCLCSSQSRSRMSRINGSSSRGEDWSGWPTTRREVSLPRTSGELGLVNADGLVPSGCPTDTNTSQFFITLNQTPELQNKHVSRPAI